MDQIYRILYCSRNRVELPLERQLTEVRSILAKSRVNNKGLGVTGALLFNGSVFAQVLEGPVANVEATFEKIQRDLRHDEVVVLEAGSVPCREFGEWAMAFAGGAQNETDVFAEFTAEKIAANPSTVAAEINELLHTLVVQEDN